MKALHAWHEFYLLVGTAAATLLALLFVAVSLGVGYLGNKDQGATRIFMSPVVIHFTSVFFISAVCWIPSHGPVFFAVLIAATAILGVAVSAIITIQILRTKLTQYVQDYFAYGLLPAAAYLALLIAAGMIYAVPIALVGIVPCVVVVASTTPVHNPKDLIAYIKANPAKLSFSSSGIGNPQQLAGELMNTMAGTKVLHAPYRGAAPAVTDVATGAVTMSFSSLAAALPLIHAGKIRAVAVTSRERMPQLPDVPPL